MLDTGIPTLLIVVVLATLLAIGAYLYVERRREGKRGRALARDETGAITSIGERIRPEAIRLSGTGAYTGKPIALDEGIHQAEYRFPDGTLVSVRLIDTATGDDDMLFVKSGEGTAAFRIDTFGHFVLVVEPADEQAAWSLEIRPFGR